MSIVGKIGLSVFFYVLGAVGDGLIKDLYGYNQYHSFTIAAAAAIMWLWFWQGDSNRKHVAVATNALLAEYSMSLTELIPENGFARSIAVQLVATMQRSRLRGTDQEIIRFFNCEPRFTQLNLIALALMDLRCDPLLVGEVWQAVENPLVLREPSSKAMSEVARRLQKEHGVSITIPERLFRVENGVLIDLAAARTMHSRSSAPRSVLR